MLCIHQFLEITSPVKAEVLVVESWLDEFGYTLPQAVREFQHGPYDFIIITGATKPKGFPSSDELCSLQLQQLGIDPEKITVVTFPLLKKYNTYGSALALRDWLRQNYPQTKAVNVFTGGTHGRKSLYLFKKALEGFCEVGIISAPLQHTPPGKWWRTKRGKLGTVKYFLGYVYTFLKPTWPKDLKTLSENNVVE